MINVSKKLMSELEDAKQNGVHIFRDGIPCTPEEIAYEQWTDEKQEYLPEFIVKDEGGDITEIWYGKSAAMWLKE